MRIRVQVGDVEEASGKSYDRVSHQHQASGSDENVRRLLESGGGDLAANGICIATAGATKERTKRAFERLILRI